MADLYKRSWQILNALFLTTFLVSCAATYGQSRVFDAQTIPPYQVSERQADIPYLDLLVVGDTGTGGEGQKRVAAAMAAISEQIPMAFALLLGDNFYELGVFSEMDQAWQDKFEKIYHQASLQIPFYAVLGNHDHYLNSSAQMAYSQYQPKTRWKMPAPYYTFIRNLDAVNTVQFFALDTNPIASAPWVAQTQIEWLRAQLEASTARWKIVYGHHPLYSNGKHGNQAALIQHLEPLFIQYGVDLYLAGHDHHLEMLQPKDGVAYAISGAGAKSRDVHWRENTLYAATNFGFATLRIAPDELVISFIRDNQQREFAYTLRK